MPQKIIRTSRLSLRFSNSLKKKQLEEVIDLYRSLVNGYIDAAWDKKEIHKSPFIPKEIQKSVVSTLSARLQQAAGKQALQIVRSQINNTKKQKIKPRYESSVVELDQRFVEFLQIDS